MIYLIPPYLLIPSLAALTAAARLISVNLHNAAIHCIDPSITYFHLCYIITYAPLAPYLIVLKHTDTSMQLAPYLIYKSPKKPR